MARSSYIYVIFNHKHHLIACFTVKHEAFTWMEENNHRLLHGPFRFPDGRGVRDDEAMEKVEK